MSYQVYRNTTLGTTLQDSLDELLQSHQITETIKVKVLEEVILIFPNEKLTLWFSTIGPSTTPWRLEFETASTSRAAWTLTASATMSGLLWLIMPSFEKESDINRSKSLAGSSGTWLRKREKITQKVIETIKVDKVKVVACDAKGSTARDRIED